ncbi:MAG TPA: NUDIX hydrolase [Candidatus Limnocylindria bacterium]|nr:NUDIX hydrolase [Candidatus Limnocylindria bacterium]
MWDDSRDDGIRETFLSAETKFEGKVITVEKWRVRLPDGREADREVVHHLGAAAVVPVDARGYVTLVRQHRVAIGRVTLEIPAGKLDFKGEDPFDCARRELEEETGLLANKWQKMAHVVTTPGFCTERIALYLATDLTQAATRPDADEFLRLERMPLSEAVARVMEGDIVDAKTCLGLLLAQKNLFPAAYMPQDASQYAPKRREGFPKASG